MHSLFAVAKQPAAQAEFELWIHVSPGARRAAVGGHQDGALRVAVRAPAREGRANAACVEALAQAFRVRPKAVQLDPRSRGRRKQVRIAGDPAALERRLAELAEPQPVR